MLLLTFAPLCTLRCAANRPTLEMFINGTQGKPASLARSCFLLRPGKCVPQLPPPSVYHRAFRLC